MLLETGDEETAMERLTEQEFIVIEINRLYQ